MNKFFTLLLTLVFLSVALTVQASIIPLNDGSYDINYSFDLKRGTLYGNDITDIFILETDGSQVSIDYAFSAAARGPSTINHNILFEPTLALLVGVDLAPSGSGLKDHLVVFMDNDLAEFAVGRKFSQVFPAIDGRPRVGHDALLYALLDAQQGDNASLGLISDFFTLDAGKYAAFDPENSFSVIEFSGGVPIDVIPEPATMLLLGTGLVGVAGAARRRKKNKA